LNEGGPESVLADLKPTSKTARSLLGLLMTVPTVKHLWGPGLAIQQGAAKAN